MITHAAGLKEHTEDATKKLYARIELYGDNQEPQSRMILPGSNVGRPTVDTTNVGSSQQVLSPRVVRGKGRPLSLRRASRMEQDMRKVKAKTKKATLLGKRKERDGGYTQGQDTCRNLFEPSEIDLSKVGNMQTDRVSSTFEVSGTQMLDGSQESMQIRLDGSQPVVEELDGSQLMQ